ncbi:hypothetical protein MPDQ_006038 [Monascus purpureus]|uniref:CCCH zinc finger domain protein n=1 Tax=Monascus purpureus TaxID=5098 RepID=A0A507QZC5_MONPU|nr:hypothetical protein MPDQ_006038 [Monascus purpureus]
MSIPANRRLVRQIASVFSLVEDLQADHNHQTTEDIKTDLTPGKGRPEWIFSAYGPGRNAPRQLFGGPQRERSFEEMRLRHYEAVSMGNANQAIQEAEDLYAQSLRQMDTILGDLNGAVKYVLDGANEHPNRIDIAEGKTGPQGPSDFGRPATFGQASQAPAFGQPSALGGGSSAFGKPSGFGQPSTFGQPSALGQGPSFGQPSTLGQTSAFGRPSGLGGQPVFGKPAFGQPAFGQPTFSQPGFGQPAFGQPSAPGTSAFGKPSVASPFGQPSTTGFGQPAQQATGPFGQPSQQTQQISNPFGQPPVAVAPFGAPAQQPTPFGQPATISAGFGQQPVPVTAAPTGPPPLIKVEDPNQLNPIPQLTGQTLRDPASNKLSAWKGQPVKYINNAPCYLHPQDGKTYVRIFFPGGPPDQASLRDAHGKDKDYTPEVTEQYQFFLKNGFFKDGIIPSVAPKREWVSFDF